MTVEKITISIPRETLAQARGAIRNGRARSISAYIASAVQQKVKDDNLLAMLDEMLAETGGPPTQAEERAAERVLGIKPRRRR
jgi:hypothetical protein